MAEITPGPYEAILHVHEAMPRFDRPPSRSSWVSVEDSRTGYAIDTFSPDEQGIEDARVRAALLNQAHTISYRISRCAPRCVNEPDTQR